MASNFDVIFQILQLSVVTFLLHSAFVPILYFPMKENSNTQIFFCGWYSHEKIFPLEFAAVHFLATNNCKSFLFWKKKTQKNLCLPLFWLLGSFGKKCILVIEHIRNLQKKQRKCYFLLILSLKRQVKILGTAILIFYLLLFHVGLCLTADWLLTLRGLL